MPHGERRLMAVVHCCRELSAGLFPVGAVHPWDREDAPDRASSRFVSRPHLCVPVGRSAANGTRGSFGESLDIARIFSPARYAVGRRCSATLVTWESMSMRVVAAHGNITGAGMNRSALTGDAEISVFLNRRQRLQYGSPEFFLQVGATSEELCGKPFCGLVVPDLRKSLESRLHQVLEGTRGQFSLPTALRRQSATPFSVMLTATALCGSTPNRAVAVRLERPADGPASSDVSSDLRIGEMASKILEGTAAGQTSEHVAARLFVSRQTVEYHISRMLRKFDMPNRVALIALAYSMGMLDANTWPPRVADRFIK